MTNQTENFMNRVTQALTRPIQTRCAELTVLFDKGNIKDTQTIFPIIVDNIFGPQSSLSWELRSITQSKNFQHYQALQHFLSPHGPMFRLIYMLLRDPQIKYEFNLTYLPTKVRQSLDSTTSHPFYAEILNVSHQTKQVVSLILNPFDYYFFHFAYHLINPWHQRISGISGLSFGSIYYSLCCDYILHFLPTNPSNPVLPILNYYVGKSPIQTLPIFVRPPRMSKLLRPNILADAMNEFNAMHQTIEQHPRNQIWRSETVLIVFVDMWLNNDQVMQNEHGFSPNKFQPTFQFNDLPTAEYIRLVRVLVKHLHSFTSSAKMDDTYMCELKKMAVPYMQGKLYVFLRNLVYRWPLDGSFRLVLELWLSFIQPWRYSGYDYLKPKDLNGVTSNVEDLGSAPLKAVDKEYLPFIVENLLAYIVIFQQLLPRFTKVDLSSPKNALMLYRMLKVMGQPNLANLLREVESSLENINSSPTHMRWSSAVPPLSPTTSWSTTSPSFNSTTSKDVSQQYSSLNATLASLNGSTTYRMTNGKWSNIIKQKVYELESSSFCYKPIFTVEPAQEVYDLIWHLKKGQHMAQAIIKLRKEEESKNSRGFFGFLRAIFMHPDYSNDEFTLEERSKVPVYLGYALEFLVDIFQIQNVHIKGVCQEESIGDEILSNQINKNDFPFLLTPEKVRERIKKIKYEGDPDLYPIRSVENAFLVRTLYQLSRKLNEQFGPYIQRLYYEDSLMGKLCREMISSPMTIHKYDKSHLGHSPRIREYLPPRITLRPLASHKFLIYMVIGATVSNFFGYKLVTFVLFVSFCWSLCILWRALISRRAQNSNLPRRQLNLSLSDSFN